MIILAAALFDAGRTTSVEALGIGAVPARRVPASFDQFLAEVVCLAVRPATRGQDRMVPIDAPVVRKKHGTDSLLAVQEELSFWVASLADGSCGSFDGARALEGPLLGSLLRGTRSDCAYRLAPLFVLDSRHVIAISEKALDRYGKNRILHSLWESERIACPGDEREYEALCAEAIERLERAARSAENNLRMQSMRDAGVRA